jgi:hypothetical protein
MMTLNKFLDSCTFSQQPTVTSGVWSIPSLRYQDLTMQVRSRPSNQPVIFDVHTEKAADDV